MQKIVRNIVGPFFKYRNLEEREVPDYESVLKYMEQYKYFRVDTKRRSPRGSRVDVIVLILDPMGKYSHSSSDLRKLIENISNQHENTLDEFILVASEEFFTKKHSLDMFAEYQSKQLNNPDRLGKKSFYSVYPYYRFSVIVPEHVSVPRHRVLSDQEVSDILKRERVNKSDFPVIYLNDAANVWVGGREGDIIEIKRGSFTAFESIYYRRVIKGIIEPKLKNNQNKKKK
jgi:DNA-directed RNA polymerase subunit H